MQWHLFGWRTKFGRSMAMYGQHRPERLSALPSRPATAVGRSLGWKPPRELDSSAGASGFRWEPKPRSMYRFRADAITENGCLPKILCEP